MSESTTPLAVLVENGHGPIPTSDEDLRHLMVGYVSSFRSPATRTAYTDDLGQFFRWCRAHDVDPLVGVQRLHGELYARHMEQRGLAPATRARRIGTVRGWYEWLLDEELWDGRNPMRKVRQPEATPVHPRPYLNEREMRILLDASKAHSPTAWAFVSLGYFCALRIGEICGADVDDVVADGYYQRLKITGKGDKIFRPVLPAPAIAAVEAVTDGRTFGPLIPGINLGPQASGPPADRLNRRMAGRILDKLCGQAGITRITPHSLRRTAITLALKRGEPLREVQIKLGRHSASRTTERYDRRMREAEEHLGDVLIRAVA